MGIRQNDWGALIYKPKKQPPRTGRVGDNYDCVIVPTLPIGFQDVFITARCWFPVRMAKRMMPRIRWIAAYEAAPVSAITHIARIASVEPMEEEPGKYIITFVGEPEKIRPIPFGDAPLGAMRGSRYTTRARLATATKLKDLFNSTAKKEERNR